MNRELVFLVLFASICCLLACLVVGGLGLQMLFVDDFCGLASNSVFDKLTQGTPPQLCKQIYDLPFKIKCSQGPFNFLDATLFGNILVMLFSLHPCLYTLGG